MDLHLGSFPLRSTVTTLRPGRDPNPPAMSHVTSDEWEAEEEGEGGEMLPRDGRAKTEDGEQRTEDGVSGQGEIQFVSSRARAVR